MIGGVRCKAAPGEATKEKDVVELEKLLERSEPLGRRLRETFASVGSRGWRGADRI